jgi:ABC-type phosphate/phosphonate transport system ATPase subunit
MATKKNTGEAPQARQRANNGRARSEITMLQFENLTKSFGAKSAVADVTLEDPDGQMVGVIGRSGAGKSTLLRMVNRLNDPTSGKILHEGRDITALKGKDLLEWRSRCAMVFQQFNLVGRLDVITNVMTGRLYHHNIFTSMFSIFSAKPSAPSPSARSTVSAWRRPRCRRPRRSRAARCSASPSRAR